MCIISGAARHIPNDVQGPDWQRSPRIQFNETAGWPNPCFLSPLTRPLATSLPQDAQEFFLHLLSTIDKNERVASQSSEAVRNPAHFFRFQFEDKIECVESGQVKYSKRDDFLLQLPVPMEMATNKSKELSCGES